MRTTVKDCLCSVIIVSANTRASLSRAIESVKSQSYTNWEIILVVPDISAPNLVQYRLEKRIKLLEERVSGIFPNFNLALDHVTGQYVSILNDDDWYESNFLEHRLEMFRRHPEIDGVYGGVKLWNEDRCEVVDRVLSNNNWTYNFIPIYQNSFLIKSSVYTSVGHFKTELDGVKLELASDYEWFLRAKKFGVVFKWIATESSVNFVLGGVSSIKILDLIEEGRFISKRYSDGVWHKTKTSLIWSARVLKYQKLNQSKFRFWLFWI